MFSNAAYRVKLNSFSAGVIINYRLTTLYNNTDTDLYSIHWHLNTNKLKKLLNHGPHETLHVRGVQTARQLLEECAALSVVPQHPRPRPSKTYSYNGLQGFP